ncbi:MAG TPA: hypothetical protein ENH01_03900 [Nitrospirae bacterium]|nr:hypothetical protein [Nitrospirota bacterium]HDZ02259.1 hypothetical protein [Nitrospirota bacterium]
MRLKKIVWKVIFCFLLLGMMLGCGGDGDAGDSLSSQTCSELGGNVCSSSQTCSGSWLDASDEDYCCNGSCTDATTFFSGDSPFGAHGGYEGLNGIGVKYKRNTANPCGLVWDLIEPNYDGVYDWSAFEGCVDTADSLGIKLMVSITSMNTQDQISCGKCTGNDGFCDRLNPCNWTKYEDFLKTAIGLYGSRIRYWQLENEPSYNGHFYIDTPENYAELLSRSYSIIKENCQDCEVVVAGMAGYNTAVEDYYSNILSSLQNRPECVQSGCFDIIDTHAGGEATGWYDELGNIYSEVSSLFSGFGFPGKPVWSTEFGSLNCGTTNNMGQALIKLYSSGLFAGFKKLFWRVSECPSWIIEKGEKTDTYYAYKTLISKIEGFNSIKKISDGQYKFSVNGKNVYVLWCDSGSCSIPPEITGTVFVTDYLGSETTMDAYKMKLTESPVFVEAAQ